MLNNSTLHRRLGYYKIDDYNFFNKGDALIHATKFNKNVTWYFNDDIFSAIDWSIPIDTSLTELYKQRAQQLRDKYDYVSLFFSGGVDSTNALHAFIDNDIFLDEIVIWRPHCTENKMNSIDRTPYNVSSETVLAAQPHLRQYIKDPRTVIRIIYLDEAIEKFVADPMLSVQYFSLPNFSPNTFTKIAMQLTDTIWNKLYSSGKNVCHIHGADKPFVFIEDGLYKFGFFDAAATTFTAEPVFHTDVSDMISKHQFHELFYWTADLPQLVIKQCQVVKKLCESSTYFYEMFKYSRFMTQDNLAPMLPYIYPPHVTEVRKLFTTSSPGSGLYAPQSIWFYENMPNHITGAFNDIVTYSKDRIDDRFFKPRAANNLGTSIYLKNPLYSSINKDTYRGIGSKVYTL